MSGAALERPPGGLEEATRTQPRARALLSQALRSGPSHAYLFHGPRGSGKRAAARAFAAEILAAGSADPDDVRRRALLDPSPHPDLVWLEPSGAQHLLEDVRQRLIRAAAYRPYEGERRVFVISRAEAMREETQNALLKTLEEPPRFAHLILLSSEPETLKETIVSRCQRIEFLPLSSSAVEKSLAGEAPDEEVAAVARLCAGDLERGRFLLSVPGRELRSQVESCIASVLAGRVAESPWTPFLEAAKQAGAAAEDAARDALPQAAGERSATREREAEEEAKRIGRRRRTEILDLALELSAAWFRDLAACASGAAELALNRDRLALLEGQSREVKAASAKRALEVVMDTRRRLDLNVSEELALEALFFRLEPLLGEGGDPRT